MDYTMILSQAKPGQILRQTGGIIIIVTHIQRHNEYYTYVNGICMSVEQERDHPKIGTTLAFLAYNDRGYDAWSVYE